MTAFETDLARRDFLKAVGALSAAGVTLGPLAAAQETAVAAPVEAATHTVSSASHFGVFQAEVAGPRITTIAPRTGFAYKPTMLQALPELVYSSTRIKYPMVRRSYLKHGYKSDTSLRGAEGFVRVSWNEALDLAANEIKRIKKGYGNQALYAGSYGWQSAGSLHAAFGLLHRFFNGYGGYTGDVGDYSTAAAQRILPHVVGSLAVYEQQTAWPVVLKNTKMIVLWGADLMQTNQIDWVTPDHYIYSVLPQLKASGIKIVSINPYRTDTDEYLNSEWVAVRAGTDVAMMLGMAHTLLSEKLLDQKFLDNYTTGFATFRDYLTGKSDGKAKDPAWAEKICGVPAATIATLAREMAKHRTMIMAGWGLQRQDHGEQPHWMLVTLASMLGQIGTPGGGFGFSYHYCSGGSPTSSGPGLGGIPSTMGTSAKAGGPTWLGGGSHAIPVTRFVDMLLNPGQKIDFDGTKVTYPEIKLIYWAGGNPFSHHQNVNRLIKAWRRPETIIVNEISWTPTAKHADIVFPVTTTMERNDISSVGSYSNLGFVAMQQLVPPMFEARSDFAIFTALADRLGFGKAYSEGRDEMGWLKLFYDTAAKTAKGVKMPSFEAFWKEGMVAFPVSDAAKNYVTFADFVADPGANALSTPSGLIEITSKTIEKFGYDDCPAHPTWMEPVEFHGSAMAAKYPLTMITPHPKYRLHSQLDGTALQQRVNKPKGRAPLWLNPADAKARHLVDGDSVRVFNDRGQALATLMVTDRLLPGMVRIEEGTWYDPLKPGALGTLDIEGSPNTLTIDKGTSKLAQGEIVNGALVQVEKYTEHLPTVHAYSAPTGA